MPEHDSLDRFGDEPRSGLDDPRIEQVERETLLEESRLLANERAEHVDESVRRFREIADSLPQIVWITDAEGNAIFFNRQWARYTAAGQWPETAETTAAEFVHPEDVERTTTAWDTARRSEQVFQVEHRIRGADGSYRWFLVRAEPYRDQASGRVIRWFGTSTDIHGQKEAERALVESESRYRMLFDSIDEGFCVIQLLFDDADRPVDYRFLEANPAWEKHTGLRGGIGRTAREMLPDLEDHWFRIYGEVATTGAPIRFESGSSIMGRWFDVYAFRIGAADERKVALLFNDVSEKKRSDEALLASARTDAYRVALTDVIRSHADPLTIQDEAARLLGEHLGATRVHYAEVLDGGESVVRRDYSDSAPSVAGVHRIDAYGSGLLATLEEGQTVVGRDVDADPSIGPDERAALQGIGVRAYVALPLVRNGRLAALLAVHDAAPRAWTAGEIALIQETAERSWEAVERTRAEAALRESESWQRFLLGLNDRLRTLSDPAEIQYRAARAVGRRLGASRVGYAEIRPDGESVVVTRHFVDGVPGIEDTDRNRAFGRSLLASLEAGETIVRENVPEDLDLSAAEKEAHRAMQVGSSVNVPLVKDGKLVAIFFTHGHLPRRWRPAEIRLLEAVASRAWDAVERARAEEALRASEEKYRTLFDSMEQGFCILEVLLDGEGRAFDLRYLETNPSFEKQTGLSVTPGTRVREVFPLVDASWIEFLAGVATTGVAKRFVGRAESMDRWYDLYAFRTGAAAARRVALLFTDITSQKRAEQEREQLVEELSQERAKLDAVVRETPAALTVLRGPEHVIELANEAHTRTISDRPLIGRPVTEAYPELAEQGVVEILAGVLESRRPYHRREAAVRIARRQGAPLEERYFDLAFIPLPAHGGNPSRIIAHTADVTEQVLARREIERLLLESERARADAEQARHDAETANQVKADFLASMSHELRTPLNAIAGYVDVLDLGIHGPLTEPQREALARVTANQRHLLTLINDVLAFAKLEAGHVEFELHLLEVGTLLDSVEPLVRPLAQAKGIALTVTDGDRTARVIGDEERVRQILLNLITNAIKFTPSGGRVVRSFDADDQWVYLRVRDNGTGIAAENQERIFDPFQQVGRRLNQPQDGVGLGLAISRDLARAMGGDLTVESILDGGSTFTLRLPRAAS
jgi:PAS domain S-box-containing protein